MYTVQCTYTMYTSSRWMGLESSVGSAYHAIALLKETWNQNRIESIKLVNWPNDGDEPIGIKFDDKLL